MIDPRSPSDPRAEFALLIDIYGAERRLWPADRQPLFDMLKDDAACMNLLLDAAALDGLLALSSPPRADDALNERLLAGFAPAPQRRGPALKRWLRLAPAGALAALSAMGFIVGSATAGTVDESLYYAQAAMEPTLSTTAGLWPEEQ